MVMAVYEYPAFATSGFSLVFFLLLGGILWFIPVGLCATEMATVEGWEEGGVFAWVSNTLGERWGFADISFAYLQIAVGFVPMLYFVLGALSYILAWPALNTDPAVKTIAALIRRDQSGMGCTDHRCAPDAWRAGRDRGLDRGTLKWHVCDRREGTSSIRHGEGQ